MRRTKLLLLLAFLFLSTTGMYAQTVTQDGVTYQVTSTTAKTACCYAANRNITSAIIRATVEIEGETYKVTSITKGAGERTYVSGRGFGGCTQLANVEFEVPTNLTKIPTFAFNACESLTSIDIPEGIETIDTKAFQFLYNLERINLPNSLTTINGHFLCACPKIASLVIPSSVTYIDGAFLHGCEGLRSVYLLGDPAALKPIAEDLDNSTFGPFSWYGKSFSHVNNCTFYVNDYETYQKYMESETWSRVDENSEYNKEGSDNEDFCSNSTIFDKHKSDFPDGYNNKFSYIMPGNPRTFEPDRWATVCFPFGVADYKAAFGEDTKAIVLDWVRHERKLENGESVNWYHMHFRLVSGTELAADVPYMIKPSKRVTNFDMLQGQEMTTEHWTRPVENAVTVSNRQEATVVMIGKYLEYGLSKAEFYFKNVQAGDDWEGRIMKAKTDGGTVNMPFRCFFRVLEDGVRISEARFGYWLEDDATGIAHDISSQCDGAEPVYTLDGRRVAEGATLPRGLYVRGGRKVIVR